MKTLILIPSSVEFQHLVCGGALTSSDRHRIVEEHGTGWALCGIGPAAAAMSAAHLISGLKPDRLILLGIAGTFHDRGLEPGLLVQAESECFADLGCSQDGRNRNLDRMNLPLLPLRDEVLGSSYPLQLLDEDASHGRFITVSSITNSRERADSLCRDYNADVENMEGAGVALACAFHRVPFFQVRALSNWVGPRDPSSWLIEDPLRRLRLWILHHLAN